MFDVMVTPAKFIICFHGNNILFPSTTPSTFLYCRFLIIYIKTVNNKTKIVCLSSSGYSTVSTECFFITFIEFFVLVLQEDYCKKKEAQPCSECNTPPLLFKDALLSLGTTILSHKEIEDYLRNQAQGKVTPNCEATTPVPRDITSPVLDHKVASQVADYKKTNLVGFGEGKSKVTRTDKCHPTSTEKNSSYIPVVVQNYGSTGLLSTSDSIQIAKEKVLHKNWAGDAHMMQKQKHFEMNVTEKESEKSIGQCSSLSTSKKILETESCNVGLKKISFVEFSKGEDIKPITSASSESLYSPMSFSNMYSSPEHQKKRGRRKSIVEHVDSLILLERSYSNMLLNRDNLQKVNNLLK